MKLTESEKKIRKQMGNDYPLIPSSDIESEARMLAVAWVEGYEKMGVIELEQKHKLASDFMNYARHKLESKEAELSRLKVIAESLATALTYYEEGDKPMIKQGLSKQALTAYAEFCKEK